MIHPLIEKKAKKVDTFNHGESSIVTEIFLEGTKFVCVVLEEKLSAPDISVLYEQIRDRIQHWMKMEWHGIIEIRIEEDECQLDGNYRHDRGIGRELKLAIDRFWMSRSPAGRVVRCDWDTEEVHRKAEMDGWDGTEAMKLTRLPLKAPLKNKHGTTMIDYDENTWLSLEGMLESMLQLGKRLRELTTTKTGLALLAQYDGNRPLLLESGKGKR